MGYRTHGQSDGLNGIRDNGGLLDRNTEPLTKVATGLAEAEGLPTYVKRNPLIVSRRIFPFGIGEEARARTKKIEEKRVLSKTWQRDPRIEGK